MMLDVKQDKTQTGYDILTKDRSKKLGNIIIKMMIGCLIIATANALTLKSPSITYLMPKVIFLTGALWISTPLFIASRALFPSALNSFKRKSLRLAIKTRKYYKLTRINDFLLHTGALGIFIVGTLKVIFNFEISALTYLTIIVLSLSFALDIYHRVKFIISKIWKGFVGKVGLALYAAISYIISNYLARHWVAYATGLNPKYYAEFINSFSIFFTPIAYLSITIILCLVIIIPECIGLLFLMFFNPINENFIKRQFPSLAILSVRLRTGKRPNKLTPLEVALLSSKAMVFRVFGAPFFLITIGYLMTQADHLSGDFFDKAGRLCLVHYYYHTEHNGNVSTMRYYDLDNAKTSIAILKGSRWEFFTLDI